MNIGIIGGGAIGLLCASYLTQYHDVTVFTRRNEQAEEIRAFGIERTVKGETCQASVHAQTGITGEFDLLIVTVKYHHLQDVLSELSTLSPHRILFLQNGMAHLLDLENWKTGHSLYIGVVEHGAMKMSDHEVNHTGIGIIKWGAFQHEAAADIKKALNETSFHFQMVYMDEWKKLLQEKLLVNVCINPLTTLLHVRNGALIQNPSYEYMMKCAFEEAVSILSLPEKERLWAYVNTVCENTAENQSSMLQDIVKGRQTERKAILGYLLKKAQAQGVAVPHLTFFDRSLEVLEKKQTKSFE
ncbi:2-dehydropantoate 2-reductase [Bacillus pumilus]|uniref:2-dehydropantoate 2-reductase n=1 Tax=Bacillus pumilus (strain SAFR-032) TaxID=315750 RepID=A8FCX0_BACP2|nr:2-dehydropantoate 2-reductase [Bacillus pumilus]ABV62087.1 2-dehydropantoate 2-reductase [Bacillus pumilus SAFR-032]AVI40799.1 2-dehydropantoate 2-reductase [Bacillus pumilus]MBC3642715.1 2-dehydropantoate 2-reductase [Bacillus pumilus]MBC3645465.1 2-dehydropantoate 2-reductase [Bacillus pumilus]MBC3648686.1 2-dehydropantoate 2-reductase [Bacillus pumilus]